MTVRAFFQATKIATEPPPHDTLSLKIFYPGKGSKSEWERNLGVVPVNSQFAPFPVVIFFSGANCEAHLYDWLAIQLAERGFVTVTFNWIAENLPGFVALTPGANLASWAPTVYGTVPSASALPALLAELEKLQAEGILAGMLDLQKIILGGHSIGGRIAIENANPRFFPQVVAAFSYGAHTAAIAQMGYEAGTILPLPDSLPLLLMGGCHDGVIANNSSQYGLNPGDATTTVIRTFREGIRGGRNDSYLVLLSGANHFSIAQAFNFVAVRAFVDFPATQPEEQIRSLMAEMIYLFIQAHVRHQPEALVALNQLLNSGNALIELGECK